MKFGVKVEFGEFSPEKFQNFEYSIFNIFLRCHRFFRWHLIRLINTETAKL